MSPFSVLRRDARAPMRAALDADGYAVVRGVVSVDVCARLRRRALAERVQLPTMHHSDTLWEIRTLPSVRALFEECWRTSDLVVGFDGMTIRERGSDDGLVIDWHVDQNGSHADQGCCCVQGLLALADSTADSGTIEFVRGSHAHHAALVKRLCDDDDDDEEAWEFVPIPPDDEVFAACDHATVQPVLRVGDVVLWDSRTIHRVSAPTGDAPRLVAYVCMVPRRLVDASIARRRRAAYEAGIATTHWPQRCVDRGAPHGPRRCFADAPYDVQRLI